VVATSIILTLVDLSIQLEKNNLWLATSSISQPLLRSRTDGAMFRRSCYASTEELMECPVILFESSYDIQILFILP